MYISFSVTCIDINWILFYSWRLQMAHHLIDFNLPDLYQAVHNFWMNEKHYCKVYATYRLSWLCMSVRQFPVLHILHSSHLVPIYTLKYLSLKYRILSLGWSFTFSAGFISLTCSVIFLPMYINSSLIQTNTEEPQQSWNTRLISRTCLEVYLMSPFYHFQEGTKSAAKGTKSYTWW